MKSIRTLIIDDEQLARDLIKNFLANHESVEVVGECGDGLDGFKKINELKPDLVFLDVMMPKLTGFEMLELVDSPPAVIFSTAYDEYAIKAFEQNAVDYLLKPYSKERFDESLKKAIAKIPAGEEEKQKIQNASEASSEESLNRVVVKIGNKIHILAVNDISYLEAQDDYVKIYTPDGAYLKQGTMKFFESNLPEDQFIRVHRSYILGIKQINKIEQMGKDSHVAILHSGEEIPVSRSGYSKLREVLGI